MYRIHIDRSLCSGFGVCAELAPDVVMVGPDGLAEIRTGLTDNPAVLEAADSCPMAAITVAVEEAA
jgi:ferredoxin